MLLAKLKNGFINQPHFSSRLSGLTFKMMPLPKTSSVSVNAFDTHILVSKPKWSQNFAHAQKNIFGTACRFYIDYFHISVHGFIRDRKHYKTVSWGEEVYVTLISQIYTSYFRDFMANLVRNIKTFFNAIKNLVDCFLLKISLFLLKYKLQSMSKKDSWQNDNCSCNFCVFTNLRLRRIYF